MSNQKTTQLRKLTSGEIQLGDVVPIVDVSDLLSGPTGETKGTTMQNLSLYIASSSLENLILPYQGFQMANGLAFDGNYITSNNNDRCYGKMPELGSAYSLVVRAFIPSDRIVSAASHSIIFGVGNTQLLNSGSNVAYIAASADNDSPPGGNNIIAYVRSGSSEVVSIAPEFLLNNTEKPFMACMTKDASGMVTLYLNGVAFVSSSGAGWESKNSFVVMGNGANDRNTRCTIYDAHVFTGSLSSEAVNSMFYRGIDVTDSNLISSYNSTNLNSGPSQWLDSVGDNHILLPVSGANATCPSKRFTLSFTATASSYLGNGTDRHVLPKKYVLTSCLVESPGKPLVCIGSSQVDSPDGSSGTGSWNDNRVALVSASYGVNPLNILALGAAHYDRSIYVHMSASAAPCTFSFDGYIRN